MKRITGFLLLLAVGLAGLASGCAGRPLSGRPAAVPPAYEVTDSRGQVVRLAQKPRRIVSLTLGTDEILLGLVTPDRIAALTYLVDDDGISAVAGPAQQVSGRIKDNAEAVLALNPDLVIVADWMRPELSQTIRDAGIAVYAYKTPATVEEVKQAVREVARVVGEEEQGFRLIAGLDNELAAVAAKVAAIPAEQRPTVLAFSVMGVFGGQGSMFDDMCRQAGVINGAAAAGLGPNDLLSPEQIVKINPDLLLLPTWDGGGKQNVDEFITTVREDPALQTIKAIRSRRLVQVPDRYLYSVSQYVVYGVREIARAAYPQYFGPE